MALERGPGDQSGDSGSEDSADDADIRRNSDDDQLSDGCFSDDTNCMNNSYITLSQRISPHHWGLHVIYYDLQ